MAGTPVSKILETIEIVAKMERQVAGLAEAVERLTLRIQAIEQRAAARSS